VIIVFGKKAVVYILMLVFLIAAVGCDIDRMPSDNDVNEYDAEFKTEKNPISDRFPKLGEFEKCYWKADIIGKKSSKLTPGPTPYWMKGYIFLDRQEFEAFKNNYKWTSVDDNWKPELDAEILGVKPANWSYSEEFNSFIKPPSFFGEFYLDIEKGIIYFDVVK
jgi:hypothetical protein